MTLAVEGSARVGRSTVPSSGQGRPLPAWPLYVTLAGYPVWWLLGPGEMVWWGTAGVMAYLLARRRRIVVPRGTGVWLLFMVWMMLSVIMIDNGPRMIGFFFRAMFLIAPTVVFVYVYNARQLITEKSIAVCAVIMLAVMTVGAYLGVLFPLFRMTTPMAYVLPGSVKANDLVSEIVFRRLTQFAAGDYGQVDPRPSAPFLYTNDWGLVYTIVLPLVIAYAITVRRSRQVWVLGALVAASLPAAMYTQNRGMFLGLGLAAAYLGIRGLLAASRGIVVVITLATLAVVVVGLLTNVTALIAARQGKVDTGEARGRLYVETFYRTLQSPFLGYGGPRPSTISGAPPSGTQGEIWRLMFAYGFIGLVLFTAVMALLFVKTLPAMTPIGLAINVGLGVSLFEMIFYDLEGTALFLLFAGAAVVMGRRSRNFPAGRPDAARAAPTS